jgi:hypothetical protein
MRSIAALLVVVMGAGCTNRVVIPVSELQKLDGFTEPAVGPRARRAFELKGSNGERLDFDASTALTLITDTARQTYRFREIFVSNTTFDAVPVGEAPFSLDLLRLQAAETEVPSTLKTLGLAAGIVAGVAAVVFATIVAIFISSVRY